MYVLFMNSNGTVRSSQKIGHNTGGGPALGNVFGFGSAVASIGDLDADGVTDLAVGAEVISVALGAGQYTSCS